jgi:adenine-specific DNA-methyltransferase
MKVVDKVKNFGQVFTPENTANIMGGLLKNDPKSRLLEPSCGNGGLLRGIDNYTAIEFDKDVCPNYALNMDFFEYSLDNKFKRALVNPPFVGFNDIYDTTKKLLSDKLYTNIFNKKANLYMFFIYKVILHLEQDGEMVFINPREFLKATSCVKLNEFIFNSGTITDMIDLGDQNVFGRYTPNCVIWRFEKNNMSRITNGDLKFTINNGQLMFLSNDYILNLNKLFDVKVGAVSGADSLFISNDGDTEFVCSTTKRTGSLRRMHFNVKHPELERHKYLLKGRRIKPFDDSNWWQWGRTHYISDKKRIYVNCKTRDQEPFFTNTCKNYDGSILALFPKNNKINIKQCVKDLNAVNWGDLGFKCGNRFLFSQRSLENTLLPSNFLKYII